jgi:carbon-monoxide dehydrogenase iron sulfur subunit
MGKKIIILKEKCVGCRACESICSLEHIGSYSPWLSRIKVKRDEELCLAIPETCINCGDAPCIEICPVGAIKISPKTGIPIVDELECTGCRQCIDVCPFSTLWFDESKKIAYKCDLCDGNPKCIQVCPEEVLIYEEKR